MSSHPVVLVTGASRGLGRGIAQQCARAGCDVAVHYQANEAAALETTELCRKAAPHSDQKFAAVRGDIAVAPDRLRLLEATLSAFGRLDGLVNNAGMAARVRGVDVTETTEESYDEASGREFEGTVLLDTTGGAALAQASEPEPASGRL